jgi:hypothetical protein
VITQSDVLRVLSIEAAALARMLSGAPNERDRGYR